MLLVRGDVAGQVLSHLESAFLTGHLLGVERALTKLVSLCGSEALLSGVVIIEVPGLRFLISCAQVIVGFFVRVVFVLIASFNGLASRIQQFVVDLSGPATASTRLVCVFSLHLMVFMRKILGLVIVLFV